MKQLVVILTACMLLALGERTAVAGNSVSAKELRCGYRVNPLGIDVDVPSKHRVAAAADQEMLPVPAPDAASRPMTQLHLGPD